MDRLDGKVPVALQKELKSIMCKNAKSAVVNGRFMTDTIDLQNQTSRMPTNWCQSLLRNGSCMASNGWEKCFLTPLWCLAANVPRQISIAWQKP